MASGAAFEAFLWSLTQQESGGDWHAVGPAVQGGHHAYGRYQVMDYNIGPWTKKYYGKTLTPQQFRYNKEAQNAVVRGVLGGYYDRYGARGAAAMWYSGQPDPSKTYGNPPVYKYVNDVMTRAGSYSGQNTGGGGSTFSVEAAVPQLTDSERAEQYGLSMRLVNSSKELKNLFKKAVAGSWSGARFQASLKNTKWWRTQSSDLRKYITLKITDPATWKQQRNNAAAKIKALAAQTGIHPSSKLLAEAVYNDLALGWSDARLKDWLGSKVKMTKEGYMMGEAGEAFDTLHELAYLNGMKYSEKWYEGRARDIVSGRSTVQTQESKIRDAAAAAYKNFSAQIKAGVNVLDLAAPYIKATSELLELPESDVDLFNRHVRSAMTGGKAGENFPLWEFENQVRNDPLWRKTNNAREGMFAVAHQVGKDFGVMF